MKATDAPFVAVLPAGDWVLERVEADGRRTVWPMVGWGVTAAGETFPLPMSLGLEWTPRPRVPVDEAAIAAAVLDMRRPVTSGQYMPGRVDIDGIRPTAATRW